MLFLAVLSVITVALALGVLAFAAVLHHSASVARGGRPSRALAGLLERATPPETDPSYGVLLRPDRDERGRDRFVAAEERLQRGVDRLRRSSSPRPVGGAEAGVDPATGSRSGADVGDGSRAGFGPGWALLPGAAGEPVSPWGAGSSPASGERRTGAPGAAASG